MKLKLCTVVWIYDVLMLNKYLILEINKMPPLSKENELTMDMNNGNHSSLLLEKEEPILAPHFGGENILLSTLEPRNR